MGAKGGGFAGAGNKGFAAPGMGFLHGPSVERFTSQTLASCPPLVSLKAILAQSWPF